MVRSKTFPAKNKTQAGKLKHAHIAAMMADTKAVVVRRGTMNGLIDDWWNQLSVAPTTIVRYTPIVRRIRERLGHLNLNEMTGQHAAEFYAWLRTTDFSEQRRAKPVRLSEATVHHHYRVLHAILATGELWDRVDRNIARKAKKPKAPKTRIVVPLTEQVDHLIRSAGSAWGTVFAFTAKSGMRRGEVCALRWTDLRAGVAHVSGSVYAIRGTLYDKGTKSGEPREVELDEDTQLLLAHWRRVLEGEAVKLGGTLSTKARVFPNLADDPNGTVPIKPDTMSQQWRRLCDREGMVCRLHALRHWNATQLLYDGISLADVAAHHGHAQVATTANFYTHARKSDGRISASMGRALPSYIPPDG